MASQGPPVNSLALSKLTEQVRLKATTYCLTFTTMRTAAVAAQECGMAVSTYKVKKMMLASPCIILERLAVSLPRQAIES